MTPLDAVAGLPHRGTVNAASAHALDSVQSYLAHLDPHHPAFAVAAAGAATVWLAALGRPRHQRRLATLVAGLGWLAGTVLGAALFSTACAYLAATRRRTRQLRTFIIGWAVTAACLTAVWGWANPSSLSAFVAQHGTQAESIGTLLMFAALAAALIVAGLATLGRRGAPVRGRAGAGSHAREFPDWMKATMLQAQKYRCAYASEGCPALHDPDMGAVFEADHIIPWSQGGVTELQNGQMLCQGCNRRKGTKSDKDGRLAARVHFQRSA